MSPSQERVFDLISYVQSVSNEKYETMYQSSFNGLHMKDVMLSACINRSTPDSESSHKRLLDKFGSVTTLHIIEDGAIECTVEEAEETTDTFHLLTM